MSEASQDNIYTLGIAKFVSGLQNEAITEQVRERIKLLILDSLGCALYGSHLEWCRIIQDTLTRVDQIRDCAVWGTKNRLSTPHAALVNGTECKASSLMMFTAQVYCTWVLLSCPHRQCTGIRVRRILYNIFALD